MMKAFQEMELYNHLQKAKEELFSCFRQVSSPVSLPDVIEYQINVSENDENYNCIRAFCIFYEGLYFEELSLRSVDGYDPEEGYILIWYKDFEGLELRDKVMCQEIK